MPDLFMVIRVLGLIGGSVGPLPYDLAECEQRAIPFNREVREHTPPSGLRVGNAVILRGQWTFTCEYHVGRPTITFDGGADDHAQGKEAR